MKFSPQSLLSAPRRSAGVPNSSGTLVLYTTSQYSFETHKKTTDLRVLDVETGESKELAHDDDISDLNWLNDDDFICLQAEKNGTTSIYVASVSKVTEKSEVRKSHYVAGIVEGPAANLKIAPLGGNEFAVVLSAPAKPDGCLFDPAKARKTQSTGKLYKSLFVRHWDEYETKEKNTLWYGTLRKSSSLGKYRLSKLTNALRGTDLQCPIYPFGGTDNFDVCRQGIILVAKDPDLDPALNIKTNVYVIHLDSFDESSPPKPQEIPMPGFDGTSSSPVFSPDGEKAAWLSMKTAGYESAKRHIFMLQNVKGSATAQILLSGDDSDWDRSPQIVCFSADSKTLYFSAEDVGYGRLFSLTVGSTQPKMLTKDGYVSDIKALHSGKVFVSGSSLTDISFFGIVDASVEFSKESSPVVWRNPDSKYGISLGLKRSQISSIWTPASNPKVNKEIHSWVYKPSDFEVKGLGKLPVAYLIHGGPQGSWTDSWSMQLNLAVFAEQGYIVVAPNPTGSTGYGQEFCDSIRKNWGTYPYEDIVNVFEWVGKNIPEADNDRAVALGPSYGGYMINWIQGHPLGRKFKALVCHDGIFSMIGLLATEELFFPFYDLGGTPWHSVSGSKQEQVKSVFTTADMEAWRKNDPSEHLANWSTPQLVIHSSKDYRLCISEGLSAFNVLQARGVDSQFLMFPDENHLVLKPENSLAWHKVVLNWINKYVGLPPFTEEDEDSEDFWGGDKEGSDEVVEMESQRNAEN